VSWPVIGYEARFGKWALQPHSKKKMRQLGCRSEGLYLVVPGNDYSKNWFGLIGKKKEKKIGEMQTHAGKMPALRWKEFAEARRAWRCFVKCGGEDWDLLRARFGKRALLKSRGCLCLLRKSGG
jgi:hypothetical protein